MRWRGQQDAIAVVTRTARATAKPRARTEALRARVRPLGQARAGDVPRFCCARWRGRRSAHAGHGGRQLPPAKAMSCICAETAPGQTTARRCERPLLPDGPRAFLSSVRRVLRECGWRGVRTRRTLADYCRSWKLEQGLSNPAQTWGRAWPNFGRHRPKHLGRAR